MFKILGAVLLALTVFPSVSFAKTITYTFTATFVSDECTGDPLVCLGQPGFTDPVIGQYDDLAGGETSTGQLAIDTKFDVDHPNGTFEIQDLTCSEMFGRDSRCNLVYLPFITFTSAEDQSVTLGGDPFWEFNFTGDTGTAEFFEIFGAQTSYFAYFDLTNVQAVGIPAVPLPASSLLMIAALSGLGVVARRKRTA